jgi:Spy/CpxP family protein refolding chaperone
MSPRKKAAFWTAALAVGSLATLAAATAATGGGHCRHGGWHGGTPGLAQLERRIDRLDLSADARTKAFAIVDASRGDERDLREKTRAAHEALRSMLESGSPNEKKLDAKVEELGSLRTQQHKQFLHTLIQVGALLPEDQRAQWFAPPRREREEGARGPMRPDPTR